MIDVFVWFIRVRIMIKCGFNRNPWLRYIILSMCFCWEAKKHYAIQILTLPNNKNPLPRLRNTVIGNIHKSNSYHVTRIFKVLHDSLDSTSTI